MVREISIHLRDCRECQREEQDLRSLKRMLANSGSCSIDPMFEARLKQWINDPSCIKGSKCAPSKVSKWLLAPVTIVTLWIICQTVLPTPVLTRSANETSRPDLSQSVTRDQIYDLTESRPLYGAPVLTAVDYDR
jgi:hypothetical protein